jgi:hypothetical protein
MNETRHVAMVPRVVSLAFHVARDPEFQEGIADGRALFPAEWDLAGQRGWWNVEDVIQFVQAELSQQKQAQENAMRAVLERDLRTPIYHLGIVAGYLSRFSEVALAAAASRQSQERATMHAACPSHPTEAAALVPLVPEGSAPQARALTFTIRDSHFRRSMQIGANLYRRIHGSTDLLYDYDFLAFSSVWLSPFAKCNALINTGLVFGWMQAFRQDSPTIVFEQGEFATGYMAGAQGWWDWQKGDLLTDTDFAKFLEVELSASLRQAMSKVEPYYTRTYQLGFAFGVVYALLADPSITIVQAESAQEGQA